MSYKLCHDVIAPCSYIRYHRLRHLPSNLVAIGDSTMQLDPIFAYVKDVFTLSDKTDH